MQRRMGSSSSDREDDDEDGEASGHFNSRQQRRRQQPLRRSTRLRSAACRVCRDRIDLGDLLECANTGCGACAHRRCAVTGAWVARNDADRVPGATATWLCAVCGLEKYDYDADDEESHQPEEVGPAVTDEAAAAGPVAERQAVAPEGLARLIVAADAAEAAAAAATEARARATAAAEAAEAAESIAVDSVHTATTLLSTLIGRGSSAKDVAPGGSSFSANNNSAASGTSTPADDDRAALKAEVAGVAAADATFPAALGDVIQTTTISGEVTAAGGSKRPHDSHDSAVPVSQIAGPAAKLARPACPICCQPVGICGATKPEACDHVFCFDCLIKWHRVSNSCPLDRIPFNAVMVSIWPGQPAVRLPMLPVNEQQLEQQRQQLNDFIALDVCAVCHIQYRPGEEFEDMLVCDHCEVAYHLACLEPQHVQLLHGLEVGESWYCADCARHIA